MDTIGAILNISQRIFGTIELLLLECNAREYHKFVLLTSEMHESTILEAIND